MKQSANNSNIIAIIKGMASQPLFIERQNAQSLLMRYDSVRQSGAFDNVIAQKENPLFVTFYNASTNVSYGKFASDFSKLEKGSIAVVPVMGAMMRDTYCTLSDGFVSGTRDLEATVKALDQNENVDGIVFYINSPGGQADGNESLSRVIMNTKTPTVGFFEGMASAAVYAFQGVNELYAAESQSYWGSIGTYISIADDRAFWESMGIEFKDIYAPQSTEKNLEFRELENGNEEPMKEMLSNLTEAFVKSVKKARPQLQDDGHVFKGKLYSAIEAKKIGAIDGVATLEHAIDRARILGKKAKKSNNVNQNQNTSNMFENMWNKLFGAKTEQEVAEDLTKVEQSTLELKEKVSALEKELSAAQATIKGYVQEIETLNGQINNSAIEAETKESNAIEIANAFNQQNDLIKEKGFESIEQLLEDHANLLQHNKELGGAGSVATPINSQQTVAVKENTTPMTANEIMKQAKENAKAALEAKKKTK